VTEDPSARMLEFADQLRQHRIAHTPKMTGQGLAALLGWRPMKVSLIERGRQSITEPELSDWARILGVPAAVHAELLQELRAIRLDQARWKGRLRRGGHETAQRSFAELEKAAKKIVAVETAIVPGPAQTAAVARIVFEKIAAFKGVGGDIDAAVAARMQRQQILYDEGKTIDLLVFEACLHGGVVPADLLPGQIDRLIALTHLSNVRLGIVPLNAELPAPPLHGFWLFDDELLSVEVMHTELTTRDPDDVQLYLDFADALWEVADEGEAARARLLRVLSVHKPPA
jgi:transcriptional regulator with XRE-family HTH domain